MDSAKISQALLSEEVGVYDDLAAVFLPKFSEEVLSSHGCCCWNAGLGCGLSLPGFFGPVKGNRTSKTASQGAVSEAVPEIHPLLPLLAVVQSKGRGLRSLLTQACLVCYPRHPDSLLCVGQHALRKIYALVRTARLSARVPTLLRDVGTDFPTLPSPLSSPSRKPHASAPSHSTSPHRPSSPQGPHTPTKQSSTGVISFLSRLTSIGSPSRSAATNGASQAAGSAEDKLVYYGELQLKIRSAFVREERLLAKV